MLNWFPWMTVKKHRELLSRLVSSSLEQQMQIMTMGEELAHWRAHGQLRDPKTGQMTKRNG